VAAALGACMVALAFAFPRAYGYGAIIFEILYIIGAVVMVCVLGERVDPVFIVVGIVVVLVLLWTLYHYSKFIDYCEQLIKTVKTVCKLLVFC
jgi:cobalamin biosynthesis protein CobD/CbiB